MSALPPRRERHDDAMEFTPVPRELEQVLSRINPEAVDKITRALEDDIGRKEPFMKSVGVIADTAEAEWIDREDLRVLVRQVLLSDRSMALLGKDIRNELQIAYGLVHEAGAEQYEMAPEALNTELERFLAGYEPTQLITQFASDLVLRNIRESSVPDREQLSQWLTDESVSREILGRVNEKTQAALDRKLSESPKRVMMEKLKSVFSVEKTDGASHKRMDIDALKKVMNDMRRTGWTEGQFVKNFLEYIRTRKDYVWVLQILFGTRAENASTLGEKGWTATEQGHFPTGTLESSLGLLWGEMMKDNAMRRKEAGRKK